MSTMVSCSKHTSTIVTRENFTEEQLDSSIYDVEKYALPFWEGNIVYNELIFPMYNENAEIPPFQLMYEASEIISVRDYSLNKIYIEGEDYYLKDGKLIIIPGGNIEISGYSLIHREGIPEPIPDDLIVNINNDGTEYFDVHNKLIKKTIAVTYIHNDSWKYFTPKCYKESFKKTISNMKNGKETKIVVIGDSVSVGYTSSKSANIPPYADAYVDMICNYLQTYYENDKITIVNSSKGGATAEYAEEKLQQDVLELNPSMVIIALGTNDAMFGRTTEDYISDVKKSIEFIKENLSDCEIIITTPHLSNPRIYNINLYKEYRAALYELAEKYKNTEVCDPLAVEIDLIENADKNFLSFTIDNLVHKNDYGMRIIAQTIVSALTE